MTLPNQKFIKALIKLKETYKEYAEILQLLIDKLEQGKEEQIKAKLKNFDNNNDWK
ncbi:MAG: hypothetical protein F6K50_27375 [Moorea sp. SIO3I7]|uniref:hypothetical protein n=1 Tax=Moorena sp. SIO3I8 TaxID=2607833 RepID=UPI0013C027D1|nr:hypothetical protein [Moorena sp. SIO3I8]NEN99075.1 hypothetical protein [Moorena sp. SIO3I7]NEO06004.1 hypothetical protein [Moorena sp. SIO3I8]